MNRGKTNWRKIIEEQVIPLLWQFRSLDIEPTIRGFFYVLADRQIILKEQSVYKNFDKALVTARKNRVIAANAFVDDTRHVIKEFEDEYYTLDERIKHGIDHINRLPEKYREEIPRWTRQPNYVEVWIEKTAMARTIASIIKNRHVVVVPNRGWSSVSFVDHNMRRLKEYLYGTSIARSKKQVWILYCGDLDPSGIRMDINLENELAREFGGLVQFKRIAVTKDQLKEYGLEHLKNPDPRALKKLRKDTNRHAFEGKFGSLFQIELDTLHTIEPARFKELITQEVDALFDDEIYRKMLQEPEHSRPPEVIKKIIHHKLAVEFNF